MILNALLQRFPAFVQCSDLFLDLGHGIADPLDCLMALLMQFWTLHFFLQTGEFMLQFFDLAG